MTDFNSKEGIKNTIIKALKTKMRVSRVEEGDLFDGAISPRNKKLYVKYHTLQRTHGCTHEQATKCSDDFFKKINLTFKI